MARLSPAAETSAAPETPAVSAEGGAGMAVFVAGGLPGSRVLARIDKVRRRHAEATAVEVLSPSPEAVAPMCPHFEVCGGCPLQNLEPARQLFWKQRQILDALSRIGRVEPERVLPAAPTPSVTAFRNKMEFAFQGLGASLRLGLYSKADPGRVFDLAACPIFPEAGLPVLAAVRETCRAAGLAAYDRRTGQGLLRHLVLRHSVLENRFLAQLLTAPIPADSAPARTIRAMGETLLRTIPALSGFVHAERARADGLAQAERTVLALGECVLTEGLEHARYRVSADAFFQTSTGGALALYGAARELARLAPTDVVFDLYCGGGGIALFLAPGCARVLGLEANAAAVADAELNARLNGMQTCRFMREDLTGGSAVPERLPEGFAHADVVVADPPREGLDAGVIDWLNRTQPSRLVYVSCNPATLARDAGLLTGEQGGFRLAAVRVVDLFPHTAHAECVGLFEPK
ncbi:MAG: 23S rRNA (uracil-5-)-methyltransferase RumA [Desulfovibrionaceae bacterium CG1_02_65_16]|nr:MAG: 23S rRNA (uracil-5-)-methyltransferase RumA [Desulfovibrionaceae bacterium CG1_02_65_16]